MLGANIVGNEFEFSVVVSSDCIGGYSGVSNQILQSFSFINSINIIQNLSPKIYLLDKIILNISGVNNDQIWILPGINITLSSGSCSISSITNNSIVCNFNSQPNIGILNATLFLFGQNISLTTPIATIQHISLSKSTKNLALSAEFLKINGFGFKTFSYEDISISLVLDSTSQICNISIISNNLISCNNFTFNQTGDLKADVYVQNKFVSV